MQLASLIRDTLHSLGTNQHERVWHLNLNCRVSTKIRELPGLSRFLLPPSFSDLRRAASGGPVVVVNAKEESCISRVVEALGKNEWVHLACRGLANRTQPFESAFALHDGCLTISSRSLGAI